LNNIKKLITGIVIYEDHLVFGTSGDLPELVRPDNIHHTHFSRNQKNTQYLKAYKYVKEFGEGIDRICNELETKGFSFYLITTKSSPQKANPA